MDYKRKLFGTRWSEFNCTIFFYKVGGKCHLVWRYLLLDIIYLTGKLHFVSQYFMIYHPIAETDPK